MKNLYPKAIKKLLLLKKNLVTLVLKLLNSLKKDFSFYNNHTELLAIWTALFMTITGLLVLAIKSSIFIMFLLFIAAVAVMFLGAFAAIYYLYAIKVHHEKRLLPKTHNFLNKSFKLRTLFRFIKIPHFSILNNIVKNFKLAS